MPLDRSARGTDPDYTPRPKPKPRPPKRPSTVAALRRQEQRDAKALVRQRQAAADAARQEAGHARLNAKRERLETTNARPRSYDRPVNPYRPTPQEQQAAVGRLRSLEEADRFMPTPVADALGLIAWHGFQLTPYAIPYQVSTIPDFIRSAREAKETLLDPDASRREKLEAGASVNMAAGLPGFGPWRGPTPRAETPPLPPRPRAPLEERIGGSLDEASKLREQQDEMFSAERGKRIGAAGDAFEQAGGGLAGHIAAKQRLAGELPKLRFNAVAKDGITPQDLDRIIDDIHARPDFTGYREIQAVEAVQRVVRGEVPRKFEIKILDELFGPEKTLEIAKDVELWRRVLPHIWDVVGLPRGFKSAGDMSWGFRQAGLVAASHPRIWKQAWGPSVKSMKYLTPAQRDAAVARANNEIVKWEHFERSQTGGVVFSGIAGGKREEAFPSGFADYIPVVGHSAQAYTVALNRIRRDFFDYLMRQGRKHGMDIDNPEFLRNTANVVNTMTGRGSLESMEGAVKFLASIFFSPRLMASRVKMLARAAHPYTWTGGRGPKANPNKRLARREARRAMATFIPAGMGILMLADQIPGVDVGLDPRSADFGKIKVGDTRVDIWGGFQQYVVLAGRLVTGEKVMSDTGEVRQLEQYGTGRVFGSATDFFENKYSPNLAYLWQWDEAGAATGRDFDPLKEAGLLFAPIGLQGAGETAREYGPGRAAAELGVNFFGFGTQTYGVAPRDLPKTAQQKLSAALKTEERTARRLGVRVPPQVRDALQLQSRLNAAVDRLHVEQKGRGDTQVPEGKRFKLTERQKAAAEMTVIRQIVPEHADRLYQILRDLETEGQVADFRRELKNELGLGVLREWHEETADALEERMLAAQ